MEASGMGAPPTHKLSLCPSSVKQTRQ